jgi:hypothetical protein
MHNDNRPLGLRAVLGCFLMLGLLAGACTNANAKSKTGSGPIIGEAATTANTATTDTTATAATLATADPSSTSSTVEPSAGTSTTGPITASPSTAPAVTAPKHWVIVALFGGSGDKEGQTFTITGAPARVMYKASALFLLNIDTGDPADDTVIGSCPVAGCTQEGAVHVVPGGWYLHVTGTLPATTYSITLEEYR